MTLAYWLNTAWMTMCRREAHAFHRATYAVAEAQQRVLQEIVATSQNTEFGWRHDFASIASPRQFQERVPLSSYEAYDDSIGRIAAGEKNVLTSDPVELLEPTSGTTRREKLIPYTRSLRRQFQRALAAWIWDLMRHRPAVRRGRAYWSISPALGTERRTPAGIPVGFDDDTAYLGPIQRAAARSLLAVPPNVAKLCDIENFRYVTLHHLVQAEDLSLLSIWNPTFLTALVRQLDEWRDRLCFDLDGGELSLPNPARDVASSRSLRPTSNLRRRSAGRIQQLLRSRIDPTERLRTIWPNLALISCWGDGAAATLLPELRQLPAALYSVRRRHQAPADTGTPPANSIRRRVGASGEPTLSVHRGAGAVEAGRNASPAGPRAWLVTLQQAVPDPRPEGRQYQTASFGFVARLG